MHGRGYLRKDKRTIDSLICKVWQLGTGSVKRVCVVLGTGLVAGDLSSKSGGAVLACGSDGVVVVYSEARSR